MTARILVTGSRRWSDKEAIVEALRTVRAEEFFADAVLVHGAARGADTIAAEAWAAMGGATEPHPAKWEQCVPACKPGHRKWRSDGTSYCPSAGHRRNWHMISLGADLCMAFFVPGGPKRSGTQDCVDLAEAAGIHVLRFEEAS